MKVLHISKYYHPFRGGIEKVIMELAEGTVAAGHEVVVLCANESWKQQVDVIGGVKVVRLPRMTVAFSQPMTMSLMWEIKKHVEWADVVHLHTPNPLAEMAYAALTPTKPLVVTYHCDVVRQKNLIKLYRPIARKVLADCDQIVVSTPNHIKYSPTLQPFKDKCEVVPFGVRAKHAERTLKTNEYLNKIKKEQGDYFLFVGRLVPYKGVDVLLKAMRHVSQNLVLIGKGPRWESWHKAANDLGVAHKVKFLGQVDDDREFSAYLHGCHSLVLPSVDESEAFGIVLIEAMSCGKPVITTDLKSGVPWVNDAGVTGLQVPPQQWEPLAQAMNKMANDHDMRLKMGEAARQRFNQYFKVETMVKSYENVYLKTIEHKAVAVVKPVAA